MKKINLAIILMLFAATSFATDFTASSPEEAIAFLKKASAGDKVILKDGVYKDAAIKFNNSNGSADKPIVFTAEHLGKVFLEGNSFISFGGNYITVQGFAFQNGGQTLERREIIDLNKEAMHCTVQDCSISNYALIDKAKDNKWVSISGQYNTLTRCFFKGKDNLGTLLVVWLENGKSASHTISYNYFLNRDNATDLGNGFETIRIGTSQTSMTDANCVVAFNRFENCDGEIEIISNKSCHNSYFHNTFVNSNGGLTLRHGNNVLCDGNFFDGDKKEKSYGIRFIGEGHVAINNYFFNLQGAPKEKFRAPVTLVNGFPNSEPSGYFQVRRAVVADNIFVNCTTPCIRIGAFGKKGADLPPDTVSIKNNLIYDDAGKVGEVYEESTHGTNITITNNNVYGNYYKVTAKGFKEQSSKNAKRDGFDWIKDGKGKYIASVEDKAELQDNKGVGAAIVDASILKAMAKRKYTYSTPKEVGPTWMR